MTIPVPGNLPLLSTIVSTYNSERFIRGCLEDLVAQTLLDRMEIIVVDSGSQQNERAIIQEFQARYPQIVYIRTEERESLYAAWNRGIRTAAGKYLTNANTDDRHRRDALERMVDALEQYPEYGLVYADTLITEGENETFERNTATHRHDWPDFTLGVMLSTSLFTAQPVWKRDAHDVVGYFEPAYRIAGDYDLFCRVAWKFGALHLREPLGLFQQRSDSLSGRDAQNATAQEILAVAQSYRSQIPLTDVYPTLTSYPGPEARSAALWDFGNLCALSPYSDYAEALRHYQEAMDVPGLEPQLLNHLQAMFANNAGVLMLCTGDVEKARASFEAAGCEEARANLESLHRGVPHHPTFFRMMEIDHPIVHDARRTSGLRLDVAGNLLRTAPHEQLFWDVYVGPNGVPLADAELPRALRHASLPVPLVASALAEPSPMLEPFHVLMVMYGWAEEGGGTLLPRQIAKALVHRGHRVSVIFAAASPLPGKPAYHVEVAEDDGVQLYGVYNRPALFTDLDRPEREADDPQMRAVIMELVEALAPDVVHYHNLLSFSMRLPEDVSEAGFPSLYTSHNYWPFCPRLYLFHEDLTRCSGPSLDGSKCGACIGRTDRSAGYASRGRQSRRMLNQAVDRHLAISRRDREIFVRNGYDADRIVVHHQAPQTIDWIWRTVGSLRKPEPELQRPLRVGFIGSLMPHKGPHVLVKALQAFEPAQIEGHVYGGGSDSYLAQLLHVDGKGLVTFHGRYEPSELPEILAGLDVVVVPSIWEEGAGLVVVEALASRCPVIGSRIGGIPDFIEDGVTGFLVDPGSAPALASALYRFVSDRGLLGRLQRSLTLPKGFEAYLDELMAHYAEVMRANPRVPRQASTRGGDQLAFRRDLAPLPIEGRREVAFFHHPDWRGGGWREVLAAYALAFAPDEDVSLVFWLDPDQGLTEEEAGDLLLEGLSEVGVDPEACPDVVLVPNRLELEGLARLFAAADQIVPHGDPQQVERADQVGTRILSDLSRETWRAAVADRKTVGNSFKGG
jgi:glycosyltransferase involved in cell wall biosynthesis